MSKERKRNTKPLPSRFVASNILLIFRKLAYETPPSASRAQGRTGTGVLFWKKQSKNIFSFSCAWRPVVASGALVCREWDEYVGAVLKGGGDSCRYDYEIIMQYMVWLGGGKCTCLSLGRENSFRFLNTSAHSFHMDWWTIYVKEWEYGNENWENDWRQKYVF